jgi:hypothetical protein
LQLVSGLFEITRLLIDSSDKPFTVLGPMEDLAGVEAFGEIDPLACDPGDRR